MKVLSVAFSAMLATIIATCVAAAQVAEVRPVRGEILVNTGVGFRAITETVQLKPGDVALAGDQASGSLIYEDGCRVDVVPGSLVWVRARSPCRADAGQPPPRDPEPTLVPRTNWDSSWLAGGAVMIDGRKPPAGP